MSCEASYSNYFNMNTINKDIDWAIAQASSFNAPKLP